MNETRLGRASTPAPHFGDPTQWPTSKSKLSEQLVFYELKSPWVEIVDCLMMKALSRMAFKGATWQMSLRHLAKASRRNSHRSLRHSDKTGQERDQVRASICPIHSH